MKHVRESGILTIIYGQSRLVRVGRPVCIYVVKSRVSPEVRFKLSSCVLLIINESVWVCVFSGPSSKSKLELFKVSEKLRGHQCIFSAFAKSVIWEKGDYHNSCRTSCAGCHIFTGEISQRSQAETFWFHQYIVNIYSGESITKIKPVLISVFVRLTYLSIRR